MLGVLHGTINAHIFIFKSVFMCLSSSFKKTIAVCKFLYGCWWWLLCVFIATGNHETAATQIFWHFPLQGTDRACLFIYRPSLRQTDCQLWYSIFTQHVDTLLLLVLVERCVRGEVCSRNECLYNVTHFNRKYRRKKALHSNFIAQFWETQQGFRELGQEYHLRRTSGWRLRCHMSGYANVLCNVCITFI